MKGLVPELLAAADPQGTVSVAVADREHDVAVDLAIDCRFEADRDPLDVMNLAGEVQGEENAFDAFDRQGLLP